MNRWCDVILGDDGLSECGEPRVLDLRAWEAMGGARFALAVDRASDGQRPRVAVAVDGELRAVLEPGESGGRLALGAGAHSLTTRVLRAGTRRVPRMHGVPYGGRPHLRWVRSAAADLVAYAVYRVSGRVGGPELLGRVEQVEAEELVAALPIAGSGVARLSVAGGWTGATPINRAVAIEIVASGVLRHDVNGAWAEVRYAVGVPVYLPGGLVATLEGSGAVAGDRWELWVGPRCWWTGEALDEAGSISYQVRAVDAAGNQSAPTGAAVRFPVGLKDPTAVAATWTGSQIALGWALPVDATRAAVVVLANWSATRGELLPHVEEVVPFATLGASATAHTFTPGAAGLWRFYVRAVNASGRRSGSLAMVEVDTTAVPASAELNVPEDVRVEPTAGGTFRLRWRYRRDGGGGVEAWRIYRHATPPPVFGEPELELEASVVGGAPVAEYVAEDLGPEASPVWYTVRAAGGGFETANTDVHAGVPDATAPSAPTTARGFTT